MQFQPTNGRNDLVFYRFHAHRTARGRQHNINVAFTPQITRCAYVRSNGEMTNKTFETLEVKTLLVGTHTVLQNMLSTCRAPARKGVEVVFLAIHFAFLQKDALLGVHQGGPTGHASQTGLVVDASLNPSHLLIFYLLGACTAHQMFFTVRQQVILIVSLGVEGLRTRGAYKEIGRAHV